MDFFVSEYLTNKHIQDNDRLADLWRDTLLELIRDCLDEKSEEFLVYYMALWVAYRVMSRNRAINLHPQLPVGEEGAADVIMSANIEFRPMKVFERNDYLLGAVACCGFYEGKVDVVFTYDEEIMPFDNYFQAEGQVLIKEPFYRGYMGVLEGLLGEEIRKTKYFIFNDTEHYDRFVKAAAPTSAIDACVAYHERNNWMMKKISPNRRIQLLSDLQSAYNINSLDFAIIQPQNGKSGWLFQQYIESEKADGQLGNQEVFRITRQSGLSISNVVVTLDAAGAMLL